MGNSVEQYRASIGSFHCGNKTDLHQCGCKNIRNCITPLPKRPHQITSECSYYASLWISQLIVSKWSKQSLLIPNSSCMTRQLDEIEVQVHSPTIDHSDKACSVSDSPIHAKPNIDQNVILKHETECVPPKVSGMINMNRKKKRRLLKKHVRFDEMSSIADSECISKQSKKQMCSLYASIWFCQSVFVYPCYIWISLILMLSGDVEKNPGPSPLLF